LDQKELYQRFKLDEPWDSPHNKPLVEQLPNVYRCPSEEITGEGLTTYQVLSGLGTLFAKPEGISLREVTDGPSNTLMVLESTAPAPWTQPSRLGFTPRTPIESLGSNHPGGFNAAFADGSVRFISSSVAPETLKAAATGNGGEVLHAESF